MHVENLKKNDIILNAKQTADLLSYGKTNSFARSYAMGTLMSSYKSGTGVTNISYDPWGSSSKTKTSSGTSSSTSSSKSTGATTPKSTSSSDSKENSALDNFKKKLENLFDGIATFLEKYTEKVDKYIKKAERAADSKKYDTAAKNYGKAIGWNANLIQKEATARDTYSAQAENILSMAKADGVLTADQVNEVRKAVQNGSMQIKDYSEEIREVISAYQEWYDKAKDAADAIEDLKDKTREYTKSLKEMRDAQRDAKIERLDQSSSIISALSANTRQSKNDQLAFNSRQLSKQNAAYNNEVRALQSDTKARAKDALNHVRSMSKSSDAKNNTEYANALKNAESAIKSNKKVSEKDINVINRYSAKTADRITAYNLMQDNVSASKLEQMINYATNNVQKYQNIADRYSNRDDERQSQMDLNEQKANNATSYKTKNKYVDKNLKLMDKTVAEDQKEISTYANAQYNATQSISRNSSKKTSAYNGANSTTRKNVDKTIKAAVNASKSGKHIGDSVINALSKYYEDGLVSYAFWQSCVNYNTALDMKQEAILQHEIDLQTQKEMQNQSLTTKASNIHQAYENLRTPYNDAADLGKAKREAKEAKGQSLNAEDYRAEMEANRYDAAITKGEISNREKNLKNYEKGTQAYIDEEHAINQLKVHLEELNSGYANLGKTVSNLKFTKQQEAIDLLEKQYTRLQAIGRLYQTIGGNGKQVYQNYQDQISKLSELGQAYQNQYNNAAASYKKALKAEDHMADGQSVGKWAEQMLDYSTKMIEINTNIQEANNSIVQFEVDEFQSLADMTSAVKNYNQAMDAIKETKGFDLTANDYASQAEDIAAEIGRYQTLVQTYEKNYSMSLSRGGAYGGKSSNYWASQVAQANTQIANLQKNVEELNNEIANVPIKALEKELALLDSIAEKTKSENDLKSARRQDLSEDDYLQEIRDMNSVVQKYSQEQAQIYMDYLAAIREGGAYGGKSTEEWLAEYNKLGKQMNDAAADVEELRDKLRDDVYWRTFERAHDACKRFASTISGLKDLLFDDMFFDEDGVMTKYGVMQVANLVKEYENASEEVQNYTADIQNLQSLYAQGMYSTDDYTKKLGELRDGVLDAAGDMKSAISSIADMYKQSAQSELDATFKLIDARKKALQGKKDYYDYDKTLKNKTKDVQDLEQQVRALEGVKLLPHKIYLIAGNSPQSYLATT